MNLIILEVGDHSGDGHDKRDIQIFKCNKTSKEVAEAYEKGTLKVGFDLIVEVATNYEDHELLEEQYERLVELGYKDENLEKEHKEFGEISLFTESYISIYKFIVQLGDPEIIFENANGQTLGIGGYGLFY